MDPPAPTPPQRPPRAPGARPPNPRPAPPHPASSGTGPAIAGPVNTDQRDAGRRGHDGIRVEVAGARRRVTEHHGLVPSSVGHGVDGDLTATVELDLGSGCHSSTLPCGY